MGWEQLGGWVRDGLQWPVLSLTLFAVLLNSSAPRMSTLMYRFVCLSVSPTRARSLAFVHFVHLGFGVPGPEEAVGKENLGGCPGEGCASKLRSWLFSSLSSKTRKPIALFSQGKKKADSSPRATTN